MLQEIKGSVPQVYEIVKSAGSLKLLIGHWHEFPSISVDYAIMEKAHNIALIPAGFGWSDLGSWQAMGEIMKKDRHGNILKGNCVDLGSKNTLVWANKRLVATLGLKDIVVVDTKDALLVCSKDKTQDVKRLVQILKQGKFKGKI